MAHYERYHSTRRHPLCNCPDEPGPFGLGTYIAYKEDCVVRHFLTQEEIDAILAQARETKGASLL